MFLNGQGVVYTVDAGESAPLEPEVQLKELHQDRREREIVNISGRWFLLFLVNYGKEFC